MEYCLENARAIWYLHARRGRPKKNKLQTS
jgi:hypothetical protein